MVLARVALVSGGKDSFYAAMLEKPLDHLVILVYEFPRPSPHLVNLQKSLETVRYLGAPVTIAWLPRGREFEATVKLLESLGANVLIAGDVYIEDHLRYMERVAAAAGAKLREPLWGADPEELLYREIESGIRTLIIGCESRLKDWLGVEIGLENVSVFAEHAKRLGFDPLGERGEYHTLVTRSPLHKYRLGYSVAGRMEVNGYAVLRLV